MCGSILGKTGFSRMRRRLNGAFAPEAAYRTRGCALGAEVEHTLAIVQQSRGDTAVTAVYVRKSVGGFRTV